MPANAATLAKARAWLDSGGYVGFKPGSLDLVCVDFDSPEDDELIWTYPKH